MGEPTVYEKYPVRIVLLSSLLSVSIYVIGAVLMAGLGPWSLVVYIVYCLWMEIRLLREGCMDCYYYGKTCAFGRGRLCALLFRQGDPQRFARKQISWSDLLPDFAVSLVPAAAAVIQLVAGFRWITLILLAALIALTFWGNAVIRGSYACRYCRQRELGCPAERLFNKSSQKAAVA
ncbi:MAG: hypothetical protein JW955_02050 [Sedimentisphaerales bacterium]|nr:hypothetical protein [Sedimentisphaerales bacterium]